jgi:hypothetical protein
VPAKSARASFAELVVLPSEGMDGKRYFNLHQTVAGRTSPSNSRGQGDQKIAGGNGVVSAIASSYRNVFVYATASKTAGSGVTAE